MSTANSLYGRVPLWQSRMMEDYYILGALGVLPRRKRYSHVFYVNADANIGKDSNMPDSVGLPYDRPKLTLSSALGHCQSGRGDFVVIQNSTSQLTDGDVSVDIADLTVVGSGRASDGYGFKPQAEVGEAILRLTAAANNVLLKNLAFDLEFGLRKAVKAVAGIEALKVADCWFNLHGTTPATGVGLDLITGTVSHAAITGNTFMLDTLCDAAIALAAGSSGGLIADNYILNLLNGSGVPLQKGIYLTAGTGVVIKSNHISGGIVPISSYNIVTGIRIDPGCMNTILTGPNYIGNCDTGVSDGDPTNSTSGATPGEGWIDISHV